ncbi:Hypothetical predicted protein [Pelobates cultripes]|uniref:Uncharacterized protein n=1 Tax=Pelobates cultripes TaxID=61616 RepID=A0AAD1W0T9_PELCU|nr:Hypothetical predicted protein [Pelobates cultripes]
MKQLHDTTKKLSGKYSKPERPIKDKEGKELLNRPAPPNPPNIIQAKEDLPINCGKSTREEIGKAITRMKNWKAETLKADLKSSVEMLYPLFKKIWEEEEIPTDWNQDSKGDLSNCNNCRGIILLSVPGKAFNRILLEWMKDAVDPQL